MSLYLRPLQQLQRLSQKTTVVRASCTATLTVSDSYRSACATWNNDRQEIFILVVPGSLSCVMLSHKATPHQYVSAGESLPVQTQPESFHL